MRSFRQYGVLPRLGKVLLVMLALAVVPRDGQAGEIKVVALGDSLTQGYGLRLEEGFVPRLQDWLAEQGRGTQVVNAGVSGDTTAGGLSRVAWSLGDGADAMIVALGGNDLLRGLDPAVSRANLAGILDAAKAAEVPVLLVGMQAPGNYGPDYKEAFDAMYPELAEAYDAVLADSFFIGLADEAGALTQMRAYMQPDGIHPNADGVLKIVDGLGPKVLELLDRVEVDGH